MSGIKRGKKKTNLNTGGMKMKESKPDTKKISCLEKMIRYMSTPIFLFEILPISGGIYLGAKISQKKGWLSRDEEVNYVNILKDVYKARKDFYFPKESIFSSKVEKDE